MMRRVQVHPGVRGSPSPVWSGEEEVEWFRNSKLSRKHRLNVPHQDTVDERVQDHHQHAASQREVVIRQGTDPYVTPLSSHSRLFVVTEVSATKPKCNVGHKTWENLGIGLQHLLPDHHETVGKIETEEDDSSCSCSNVGSENMMMMRWEVWQFLIDQALIEDVWRTLSN